MKAVSDKFESAVRKSIELKQQLLAAKAQRQLDVERLEAEASGLRLEVSERRAAPPALGALSEPQGKSARPHTCNPAVRTCTVVTCVC